MESNLFNRKVVFITGAGRGAGKAIAEGFAAQGARVAANDISPVNVDEVVAAIKARGGQAIACVDDVAKKVSAQAMLNNVLDKWGRLDILINSANVEPHAALFEMDEWDWHRTLDVNLTGPFLMMQSAARVMRDQGGGVIVNVAPVAGREDQSDRAAYHASKVALAALTHHAALEFAEHNVRVHAVCTGMPYMATTDDSHEDVVTAVLALCGPDYARLTGQIVNIS